MASEKKCLKLKLYSTVNKCRGKIVGFRVNLNVMLFQILSVSFYVLLGKTSIKKKSKKSDIVTIDPPTYPTPKSIDKEGQLTYLLTSTKQKH